MKLDENLGRTHLQTVRSAGYDADATATEGLNGQPDSVVWQRVCADERLFITLDLDFSDIRRFAPGTHPGIVLIRSHSRSVTAIDNVLRRVLAEHTLDSLAGCLVVADPEKTRIRRPRSE